MTDYQLLQQSKWVNGKWYLEQYPDVAILQMDPIEHYLRVGARLGRDPCKRFSTNYYLSAYPDVADSGMNPLVHWVSLGQHEGRSCKPSEFQGYIESLWQGHSSTALRKLKSMLDSPDIYSAGMRWNALWHLARWSYFCGDYEQTLALTEQMNEVDASRHLRKERVLLVACCLQMLGRVLASQQILDDYLQAVGFDSDVTLARANVESEDSGRLRIINSVFEHYGLHPVTKWDETKPLTLHNLHGAVAVDSIPPQAQKVSVIIPAFNAAARIEIVLSSLLNQTWRNLEVIVVDDCSEDDTLSIVESVAQRDPRVRAIRQTENGGAYRARNTGLQHASGDFITTHDSDDWSHPQKIETQVDALLENQQWMGVALHWVRATESVQFTQNWRPNNELIHWSQSSFMFRKQVVNDLGYWDEVRIGGDTEFIWRVQAKYGKEAVQQLHPEIPFAFALDDEGSLTRTKATHVRTVYFGLRHIYRALCRWWHEHTESLHVQGQRPFAVPQTMVDRTGSMIQLDVLLIGDFADPKQAKLLLAHAKLLRSKQQVVGVFHWPTFASKQNDPVADYCQAVYEELVTPIVFADPVAVTTVYVISADHVKQPIEALPEFYHLDEVKLLIQGKNKTETKQLRAIFANQSNT